MAVAGENIATCCYCGARSVLCLSSGAQRELACPQCGAPVRNLKPLKARAAPAAKRSPDAAHTVRRGAPPKPARDRCDAPKPARARKRKDRDHPKRRPERRPKRRPMSWSRMLSEGLDEIADVFEEIFD